MMQATGLKPQLSGIETVSHTLALRSLCTKLASAVRIAPRAVFSNQAPLHRHLPAPPCRAIMEQRDIASFFTKPAGAAAKPPSSRATPADPAPGKRTAPAAAAAAKPDAAPTAAAAASTAGGGAVPEVLRETKNIISQVCP